MKVADSEEKEKKKKDISLAKQVRHYLLPHLPLIATYLYVHLFSIFCVNPMVVMKSGHLYS